MSQTKGSRGVPCEIGNPYAPNEHRGLTTEALAQGWDEGYRAAMALSERPLNRRQRAELQALRDNQQRLINFDGGAELLPWVAAHQHHKDEPYIGCLFCRDEFVLRSEALTEEAFERAWQIAVGPDGPYNHTWGILQPMKPEVRAKYEEPMRAKIRELLEAAS